MKRDHVNARWLNLLDTFLCIFNERTWQHFVVFYLLVRCLRPFCYRSYIITSYNLFSFFVTWSEMYVFLHGL